MVYLCCVVIDWFSCVVYLLIVACCLGVVVLCLVTLWCRCLLLCLCGFALMLW